MAQTVIDYARAAVELDGSVLDFVEAQKLIDANPELFQMLCDPGVSPDEKQAAIDAVLQDSVKDFLRLFIAETEKTLHAVLICTELPEKERETEIKEKLKKLYDKPEVELEIRVDKSIIGGFILRAEGNEFDYSIKSRLDGMKRELCRG